MSSTKVYNFETEADYNFDSDDIELVAGKAQLKVKDEAGLTFTEDFTDDTGFTYDNTKAEFTGGVLQQVDQSDADAETWMKFSDNIDANATAVSGDPTGTSVGGAAISGGKLDLNYDDIRYVQYDGAGIADFMLQTFSIKLKVTPNYNGQPPATNRVWFASAWQAGSKVNRVSVQHNKTAGALTLIVANLAGIDFINQSFGTFNAVAGQEYEVMVCVDVDVLGGTGATRFYLDGVQKGPTNTAADNRNSNTGIVRIGSGTVSQSANYCSIRDVVLYPSVQETGTSYIPGYTLEDARYLGSKAELPQFEYTRLGDIQRFTNFTVADTNDPHYVMNDLYYNSGWVSSDGSYSQSNTEAQVLANIATLPASNTVDVDVVFTDNNEQQQITDDLVLTYTGQHYDETNPIISIASCCRIAVQDVFTFVSVGTITGSDLIKYIVVANGTKMYWDGADWVASNGTYSQSNTEAEISTNIPDFTSEKTILGLDIFLHSEDGTTTPAQDTITVTYDAALPDPTNLPRLVDINGHIYDNNGPETGIVVEIRPYQKGFNNPNDGAGGGVFQYYIWKVLGTSVSDGFFSGSAYLQPDGEQWEFKINKQRYRAVLPDQDAVDFNALTLTLVEA